MSNIVTKDFTKDQLQLIKDTVAKGASDNELKLFLYRCESLGLDPLKPGQIYFIKYGSTPGTIVVGIDGFRAKASATGLHAGTKRGLMLDDSGKCIGAWCEVYRSDWKECAREESLMEEYNTGKAMWAKMPTTMIKKVAECAALRMAFPDQLSGVYESSEMDQAEPIKEAAKQLPTEQDVTHEPVIEVAADENDLGSMVASFGKYKGQAIKTIDLYELDGYIKFIESQAVVKGKQITGQVLDFITAANSYLDSKDTNKSDSIPF